MNVLLLFRMLSVIKLQALHLNLAMRKQKCVTTYCAHFCALFNAIKILIVHLCCQVEDFFFSGCLILCSQV